MDIYPKYNNEIIGILNFMVNYSLLSVINPGNGM